MNLLATLVIGGLAGWLASIVMKTDASQGIILNIIVGIVGAFIGSFVLGLFGVDPDGGLVVQLLVATLGAVILLAIVKAVRK